MMTTAKRMSLFHRRFLRLHFSQCLLLLWLMVGLGAAFPASSQDRQSILDAVTFHASFDHGVDADMSQGDAKLYTLIKRSPAFASQAGLHTDNRTQLVPDAGLQGGGALRFTDHRAPWLFYDAQANVAYRKKNWSGTVSLWLKVDPQTDLAPGYCDPIQITPRQWNDAAFFVDFNKDGNPRDFRLGAFADLKVWNEAGEDVNDIPENRRPLLPVKNPPFTGDHWTHVVFTWEGFNTGRRDGRAMLYLNGKPHGPLTGWDQTFTWPEDEESRLLIGLNYIGWFDELACFNRALTAEEVQYLHRNPRALEASE